MIQYTLDGPHTIVLDASATARWQAGDRDDITALAQSRADHTGHVCIVVASNVVDVLAQIVPEPPPTKPEPFVVFGGGTSWAKKNLRDTDGDED